MARDKRSMRTHAGPGRGQRRARTARSATTPVEREAGASRAGRTFGALRSKIKRPTLKNNLGLTRRALVFFAVLALLALSYVNSLRTYLVQQSTMATTQQQIAERSQRASDLQRQLDRWHDPAFVKSQARTRLGWVMPGEVGYRVVDANGEVMSGTNEIEGVGASETNDLAARWWDKLATSMRHADEARTQTDTLVNAESPDGTAVDPAADADAAAQPAGR